MITKIVAQLKTGSVKDVVPYGQDHGLKTPYVIVRPERDLIGRGRVFYIIAHYQPTQQVFLENYIFGEVRTLLDGFKATDRHGNYNELLSENDYTDIISNNDDGTISMEIPYLMPFKIFK